MKKFTKYLKYIIPIIIIILFIIAFFIIRYKSTHSITREFSKIDLTNINKLMIVAHPDDELLWGGSHLIEDDYLVVCITCGSKKNRVDEFVKVMNKTKDKYIMLGYPDKTNGERDNWDSSKSSIIQNLEDIINIKDWEHIVTHNPDGEYGHIHHKMTSEFVTDIVNENQTLYYFGHYYSKKNIADHYEEMIPIDGKTLSIKKDLLNIYKSQSFIKTSFDHIYSYENWVLSTEWES